MRLSDKMDFKMPERAQNSHKGTFGRVLNVSGSDYMPGAAVLSSLAALKIGCGYVFLCSSERVINAASAQTQNIVFAPLSDLENQIKQADVLLIGCGLSTSYEAETIFKRAIESVKDIPVVIDADGLNILAKFSAKQDFKIQNDNLIFTPHPKEAARLLDCRLEDVLSDIENSAKEISQKYNSVTVLKSHRTIVCSKNLEIYVNYTGNSALAKAGSGDVLAGMISGLLAQKCEPVHAAKLGVYLHGLCAEIVSERLTEYSVLSEDIINTIPLAVKSLQ